VDFDLIVFDWDGTLMDSEARIVNCMRDAFAELGIEPPARAAVRDVIGLGLDEAVHRLWPAGSSTGRQEIMSQYRQRFLVSDSTPAPLFEGAAELVQELYDGGRLLGVATGKSRRGLDEALAASGLAKWFHATRCADETFSKPHPAMLEALMDELGVSADRTLMIGDTEFDMELAHNAKVAAVAVGYGAHAAERLIAHGPLACAMSIDELREWLRAELSAPALD
jgi:phosphoglycolate phosphatase